MTALGRPDAGLEKISSAARELARRHGDAATTAFCVQMDATVDELGG